MATLTINNQTHELPTPGDAIYLSINGTTEYFDVIEVFPYDDVYQIVVDNHGIEEIVVPDHESTKDHGQLCYKEFDN